PQSLRVWQKDAAIGIGFYGNSETNDGVYQLLYALDHANHTLTSIDSLVGPRGRLPPIRPPPCPPRSHRSPHPGFEPAVGWETCWGQDPSAPPKPAWGAGAFRCHSATPRLLSAPPGTLIPTSPVPFAEVVHYYLYCDQSLSNPFQQALTVFQRSLTTMQIQIQGLIQFALPLFPTAEVRDLLGVQQLLNSSETSLHQLTAMLDCRGLHKVRDSKFSRFLLPPHPGAAAGFLSSFPLLGASLHPLSHGAGLILGRAWRAREGRGLILSQVQEDLQFPCVGSGNSPHLQPLLGAVFPPPFLTAFNLLQCLSLKQ
uniref:Protein tweety homolog n=1 Tax=Bubo bubo TaxID=30461 RepID=A0A8C0FW41_BUBBB